MTLISLLDSSFFDRNLVNKPADGEAGRPTSMGCCGVAAVREPPCTWGTGPPELIGVNFLGPRCSILVYLAHVLPFWACVQAGLHGKYLCFFFNGHGFSVN